MYRKLWMLSTFLHESCAAQYFLFSVAKVVKLVLKIGGNEVKEFQAGSNVQISELT